MLPDFTAPFKRLRVTLWPPAPPPSQPPDLPCPLTHPDAPLPSWVEADPIVQKYRTLLGALPWVAFPERPPDRAYPGPAPDPRAPFRRRPDQAAPGQALHVRVAYLPPRT